MTSTGGGDRVLRPGTLSLVTDNIGNEVSNRWNMVTLHCLVVNVDHVQFLIARTVWYKQQDINTNIGQNQIPDPVCFLGTIALQINIISRDYNHSMNLFISFGMN